MLLKNGLCGLETVTTGRMKCDQHPAEVFSSYWVSPALVHGYGEITNTALMSLLVEMSPTIKILVILPTQKRQFHR